MDVSSADNNTFNHSSISFEEALAKLEAVVKALEGDKVPLKDLIELYQSGMKYKEICETKLKEAKLQIEQLQI